MALSSFRFLSPVFSKTYYNPLLGSVREIKRYTRVVLQQLGRKQKLYRSQLDPKELLERERRSRFAEWNRDAEVYAFGKRLQEDFRLDLLDQAFIHRSYITLYQKEIGNPEIPEGQSTNKVEDNQDLIEIGERIISDHVWNYFSTFYPRFPLEGIKNVHDHLTSDELLAYVSKNLGTTHLILSADYPVEKETYAMTLKAIVGALMESQGIEKATIFVRDLVVTQFAGKDINDFLPNNYFEALKDIMARNGSKDLEPRIIGQTGMNTILANYHIGIYSEKKLCGHGSGESIETGIEMAALDALKRLFHTTDSAKPIRYDAVFIHEGKINNNKPLQDWCIPELTQGLN